MFDYTLFIPYVQLYLFYTLCSILSFSYSMVNSNFFTPYVHLYVIHTFRSPLPFSYSMFNSILFILYIQLYLIYIYSSFNSSFFIFFVPNTLYSYSMVNSTFFILFVQLSLIHTLRSTLPYLHILHSTLANSYSMFNYST